MGNHDLMKALYDTQTGNVLPWPRLDEEPVVGLAAHLLEMTVVQEPQPAFDPATQRLEKTEVIDAEARTVVRGWSVVEVEPPTYTATEWVDAQGFSGNRTTTMLYLKLQLDAAGKSSPKLASVQGWLDQLIVAGVTQPDLKRGDWEASPYSFEEASAQALAAFQS
jgi:hypothetical protein